MRKTPYASNYVNKVKNYFAWAYRTTTDRSACIESVSVWFRSKERPRNDEEWDFRFWLHDKWDENPFFAWSLTLIPYSLLQNCTETPDTDRYNPGQNVLGLLRKLGTKTHFAKLTHILPLKKAWGCCYKGLFLLFPSPPSSVDCVELKLECITSTLLRGEGGREDASIWRAIALVTQQFWLGL